MKVNFVYKFIAIDIYMYVADISIEFAIYYIVNGHTVAYARVNKLFVRAIQTR